MDYKLVIIVRKDLKLTPGKLAVQVAHASVENVLKAKKNGLRSFKKWHEEGQKKVVVKAPNMEELGKLKWRADQAGLITSLIRDAGLTEIPPGTVTCLGIGPASNAELDQITGHLHLF